MASSVKRVTAWFRIDEWQSVYHDLFSNDHVRQKHAVARISVWKSRILHRLSSGIECTWYLMSALIQDRESQQHVSGSEQQLCLAYSMAIVRFVNHLTEKSQNKHYVQAVHVLAEELGLPLWLVEMRHDATHASLPSLPLLRCATQYALAWIKREYWDAIAYDDNTDEEDASPTPQTNPKMAEKELEDKLIEFMQEQFSQTSEGGHKAAVKLIIHDLRQLVQMCREKSVSLLTSEGYLILTESQLEALRVDVACFRESVNPQIPKPVVRFWAPVISLYQSLGLLPQILLYLGQELSEGSILCDQLRASWIITIIRALTNPDTGLHLKDTTDEIDGLPLLRMCLRSPNNYTYKLVTGLFAGLKLPVTSEQKHDLLHLIECYNKAGNQTEEAPTDGHRSIYTVNSLLLASDHADDDSAKKSSEDDGWQLAGELSDWVRYPIGACPRVTLTCNSLELDGSVDKLISMTDLVSDQDIEEETRDSDEHSTSPHNCEDTLMDVSNDMNDDNDIHLSAAEISKHICLM